MGLSQVKDTIASFWEAQESWKVGMVNISASLN